MVGAPYGDGSQPAGTRLGGRDTGHLHRDRLAKSPMAVDDGRGCRFGDDLDSGAGNDLTFFDGGQVLRDAYDAVRIMAHEIRFDEPFGDALGFRRRRAGGSEQLPAAASQSIRVD